MFATRNAKLNDLGTDDETIQNPYRLCVCVCVCEGKSEKECVRVYVIVLMPAKN